MKDIKSSLGGTTFPADENPGTLKAIVVRNKGSYGRRIGILAENGTVIAGSKLHAADYRHTPEEIVEFPDGFNSGLAVELSAQRIYHSAFVFNNTIATEASGLPSDLKQMSSIIETGISSTESYDPETSGDVFKLDSVLNGREIKGRNHLSFSLILGGQTYHLGLEFNKHPAKLTADLNSALANIHPKLRGVVCLNSRNVDGITGEWEIKLAAPNGQILQIPKTNFIVENINAAEPGLASYGSFQTLHLNNLIADGIELTATTRTTYEMEPLSDPNFGNAKTVAELVADAFKVEQEITNELEHWGYFFDIPANRFHPYIHDPRYRIALVELSTDYRDGDLHRLEKVTYDAYTGKGADLLTVPKDSSNSDPSYGTYLIDIDASLAAGKLVGGVEPIVLNNDGEQTIVEQGGINYDIANGNIYGTRFAIAVIAPPNYYNGFSPLFRSVATTTPIMVGLQRFTVEPLDFSFEPQVYNWEKTTDNKIPIIFRMEKMDNGVITGAIAGVRDITITEPEPIITEDGDYQLIEFNDGFSSRDLTFGYSSGTIGVLLKYERELDNASAFTRLNILNNIPYTVITPEVASEIVLDSHPAITIAPESEELVTFTGRVRKPTGADSGLKQPTYYSQNSNIELWINDISVTGIVSKPTVGNDSEETFSISLQKDFLSTFGTGTHTLKVDLTLILYWDLEELGNIAELEFTIIPEIEGTEDDITFIPSDAFLQTSTTNSPMRIIDTDTGEILAEGDNVDELIADATTRGLISIDAIIETE